MLAASWQRSQPDLLARTLQPLSWLYGAAAALHRALYTSGLRARERAPVPLLVVGNLVAGGAGKTPTVIALVEQMRQRGYTPGVISRGYGRKGDALRLVEPTSAADDVGDEPLLIHLRTRAPVAVAVRRIDAARALCQARPELDLLIADDGLQHHALARDAQVIVFDERGVGNGLLLPAGPLREPMPAQLPERSVVLYNAERASTPWPGLSGAAVDPRLGGACRHGGAAKRARGEAWAALQGRRVVACAGTAMPQRFFSMLQQQGLTIEPIALPDHARFGTLPWPAGAHRRGADRERRRQDPSRARGQYAGLGGAARLRARRTVGAALAQWLPPPR